MSLADLIESSVVGASKAAKELETRAKETWSEVKRVGEKIFGDNDEDSDKKLKSESDNDKENASDSSENEKEDGKMDKDPFAMDKLRYPIEIQGLDDPDGPIKHWVTFYISEYESSKYASKIENFVTDDERSTALGAGYSSTKLAQIRPPTLTDPENRDIFSGQNLAGAAAGLAAGGSLGLISGLLSGGEKSNAVKGAAQGAFIGATQNIISQRPKTKMLKKTINIYMPDTVMTRQQHNYKNVDLTDMFGDVGALMQIGSPMLKGALDGFKFGSETLGGDGMFGALEGIVQGTPAAGAAEIVGRIGESAGMKDNFKDALVRSQGFAINPQVELFFTGTERRQFQFDFRFNSRSEKETEQIKKIIKSFRMHSAPSMPAAETGARYFVPPSQFDIKFYFRKDGLSVENEFIAKIGTCVLESVDVNYVGSGRFMTFEDGQPVDIEVRLSFQEVDIMTREAIEKGY